MCVCQRQSAYKYMCMCCVFGIHLMSHVSCANITNRKKNGRLEWAQHHTLWEFLGHRHLPPGRVRTHSIIDSRPGNLAGVKRIKAIRYDVADMTTRTTIARQVAISNSHGPFFIIECFSMVDQSYIRILSCCSVCSHCTGRFSAGCEIFVAGAYLVLGEVLADRWFLIDGCLMLAWIVLC